MQASLITRSFGYFTESIFHPGRAFNRLKDENSFRVGFFLNALKWVLCEFYVYYLYKTNQVLFLAPWIHIPAGEYRFYQLFFYIPYGILAWIFTAGVIQTISITLGGKGSFTETLNIVGVMIFTPFVFIDTIDAVFILLNGGDWNLVFNSITRTLYVFWSGALLVFGLQEIHQMRIKKSIAVALLIIPLSIFINVIFIR